MKGLKKIWESVKAFAVKVRKYVSPAFVGLLVVSFSLWYISKLQYTYTTEFEVKVNIDGERFTVPCVVEGKGTNLFGYKVYTSRRLNIPLEELRYTLISDPVTGQAAQPAVETEPSEDSGAGLPDGEMTASQVEESAPVPAVTERLRIDPASLKSAISVRFSDIKIVSVGNIPEISIPEK